MLYLSHVAETSGAEESLLALVSRLDRTAFDPLVVLPGPGSLADALAKMNVETQYAPLVHPKRPRNPWALAQVAWSIASARRHIAKLAQEREVSIIHANSTAAALQAPRLPGVPLLWHCRDLVPLGWTARHLSARVSAIVAIGRAVWDQLEAEIGDARKVHLIYNGIDTQRFRPGPPNPEVRAQLGAGPGDFLVGMAGQLIPWKRHRVFLHAAADVAQRVPDARFAIVGGDRFGNDAGYENELHAFGRRLGIEESLTFAGQRDDMPDIMRALDVLVQPSVAEPFGRTVAEAMSTAKPVIAVARAGPAEIISDDVSGMLVPPDDSKAIAGALVGLAADADRAERLGLNGRERICARFPVEAHVAAIEELYRRL